MGFTKEETVLPPLGPGVDGILQLTSRASGYTELVFASEFCTAPQWFHSRPGKAVSGRFATKLSAGANHRYAVKSGLGFAAQEEPCESSVIHRAHVSAQEAVVLCFLRSILHTFTSRLPDRLLRI